jgi:replication factor C large subunit
MTCNSAYDQKLRTLRECCQLVQFKKFSVFDIEKRLKQIADSEGIRIDKEVMRQLAKRSEGDLRASIIDLESMSHGKKEITQPDLETLSYREKEQSIFDALMMIFKTKSALAAKLAINNVDKDPDEIFWWIENNIANEYEDPEEIAKTYDILSKADLFRQRIKLRQNWKFLAYMIDLMTGGVATAKKEMYRKFTRYQYPSNLIVLGGSKFERKEEKERLLELSQQLHCSTRKVRKEFLPFFKLIFSSHQQVL